MTKEELFKMKGDFTWDFGCNFFIETENGNFIWSDPGYQGDNTIVGYNGSYSDFFGERFGRSKGSHIVGEYVDNNAILKNTV